MIRDRRASVLAFFTVLAATIFATSAAQAAEFTASEYPAQITGSNTSGSEVFATEGGKAECDTHYVSHSSNGPSSTLTITPTFTNCRKMFGFSSGSISTEGCSFLLHATEGPSVALHHLDIVCPAGQSIKFSAGTCKMEIKAQNGKTSIKTTNLAGGTMTVQPQVSGIAYTVTEDGWLCPFGGKGNKTDGSYTGDMVVSRVGGGSISVS